MLSKLLSNFRSPIDTDIGKYFQEINHKNLFRVDFRSIMR